jgi:hypothetical protein
LAAVGIVALVLAAALWLRKEILHRDHSIAPVAAGISAEPRLRPEALWGKRFIFNFKSDSNAGSNGRLTLQTNGTIAGTKGPNESFWLIDRDGHLVFKHLDGRVSTIFTVTEHRDGKWYFCGQYQFNPRVQNFLEEDVTSDAATTMTGTKTPAVAPQQDAGTLAGSDAKPRVNGFDWTLDTSQSPDLNDWAETKLKPVVDQWYPLLVDYFASDGFTAPKRFKITISPRGGNVSFAGTNIQLSGAFVRNEISKPGDWNQATGSVIWALARVVQQYGNPPWLAYGVANYYRWFCYEPAGHRPKMSAQSAAGHNYSDTNITTECFLDYVVKNHDPKIVSKMNAAMRQGHYSPDLWKEYTGMSVEDLWAEYVKSL